MKKAVAPVFIALSLVYCLFILGSYFQRIPGLASVPELAYFVFGVIGSKFLFISALGAAAFGIGGFLFSRWLPEFGSLLEEGLIKVALGLVVISYLVFFLGLAGLLYPVAGYAVLIACMAVGVKGLARYLRDLHGVKKTINPTFAGVLVASLMAYLLIRGLYQAFLPPTAFDVLMYHYGVPRMYLDAHGIFPTPDINGSSYPFMTEMLYMLAMMVESDISANLVNLFFAVGCALIGYQFTRRFLKDVSPFLASAFFIGMPIVVWLMPQAYVELSQGFYVCLAVYALAVAIGEKGTRWLYVSAGMAGAAMCIKYTSNLVLVIMAAGVIYKLYFVDRAGAKGALLAVIKYSLIALLAVSPWYVKNAVYYGNPFFPMLASGGSQSEMGQYWTMGMKAGPADFLLLPWNVTMAPGEYYVGTLSSLGPSLLMFIPGLFLCRKLEDEVKYLLAFCLMYIVVWYLTAQNIRYLVPVGPLLAVLAAYPIGRLVGSEDGFRRVAGRLLVAVFLFASVLSNTAGKVVYGFPAASDANRDDYYTEKSGAQEFLSSYGAWKWINANLPADAVIYQLWDDASVYFRARRTLGFPGAVGDRGRDKVIFLVGHNSFGGFRPGQEIAANLKAMGASYLLINANREGNAVPDDPYFNEHAKLIYQDSGIFLYQLVD